MTAVTACLLALATATGAAQEPLDPSIPAIPDGPDAPAWDDPVGRRIAVVMNQDRESRLRFDRTPRPPLFLSGAFLMRCETDDTTVVSISAPGTLVRKGDVVAELGSTAFREQLERQTIVTDHLRGRWDSAQKGYELLDLEIKEFLEGIDPAHIGKLRDDRQLAYDEFALTSATAGRSDRARADAHRHLVDEAELRRARLTIRRADNALDRYLGSERPRLLTRLKARVDQVSAENEAAGAAFEIEAAAESELRRMIERCRVYAPADGRIRSPRDGTAPFAPGDPVRRGQVLLQIEPIAGASGEPPRDRPE